MNRINEHIYALPPFQMYLLELGNSIETSYKSFIQSKTKKNKTKQKNSQNSGSGQDLAYSDMLAIQNMYWTWRKK